MKILEVENLSKIFKSDFFKKTQVLKNVTFSISKGRSTGFIGLNGSGKTTTLKCILDFIRPTSGSIKFFNTSFQDVDRRLIGYLPERPYLYEFLTAEEFLRFHWRLCFKSSLETEKKRIYSTLEQVHLLSVEKKKLRFFSKGMLQRVGLAQVLLTDPEFIILDEPMSGLDPDGRYLLKNILRTQKEQGKTLFFTSHLLQDIEDLCEDIVIIDQGCILYHGELSTFRSQYPTLEAAFAALRKETSGEQ